MAGRDREHKGPGLVQAPRRPTPDLDREHLSPGLVKQTLGDDNLEDDGGGGPTGPGTQYPELVRQAREDDDLEEDDNNSRAQLACYNMKGRRRTGRRISHGPAPTEISLTLARTAPKGHGCIVDNVQVT